MTFEQAIREAGEFGFFQKIILCCFVSVSMSMISNQYWMQIYILLTPPHRCKVGYDDQAWALVNPENITIFTSSECHLSVKNSSQSGNNSEVIIPCPYGWVYDYTDLYPTFTSQSDWVCNNSWKVYTVHTCYWISGVIGFLLFGSLSDRFGRKRLFIYCASIMLLADIGTYFTTDFFSLLISRAFSSVGEANLGNCAFVLAIEYAVPKYRVLCLLLWSLSFTFMATVTPWIAFALGDWHNIVTFAWIISSASIIVTSFMPESASWLMTRRRVKDAAKCIQWISKINGKNLSLHHIEELLEKEECNLTSINKVQDNNGKCKPNEKYEQISFSQAKIGLIKTPNMRKNTVLITILWMIASVCYVGSSLETSKLPWSFCLAYSIGGIVELPANIICLFTLDRIGRRWTIVILLLIGGFFGITAGTTSQNTSSVLALAFVMRTCSAATYDIIFTLALELFPTVVRGTGVTIIRIFGRFANATAPFIFSLSERNKLLPLAVFGVLCIIGGIITLFLPETAGQNLPHTLEEGENFGKAQSFFYCPLSQKEKTTDSELSNDAV